MLESIKRKFRRRGAWPEPVERIEGDAAAWRDEAERLERERNQQAQRAEALMGEVEELQGKVERYFNSIATIERERDEWAGVAHDAIAGHQRAQELMVADIRRLHRTLAQIAAMLDSPPASGSHEEWLARLRKLAKTPADPTIQHVLAEFSSEFDSETGRPAQIERAPGQGAVEGPKPAASGIT